MLTSDSTPINALGNISVPIISNYNASYKFTLYPGRQTWS